MSETIVSDTDAVNNQRLRQLLPKSEWRHVYYKKRDSRCMVCGIGFFESEPVYHVIVGSHDYFVCTDHELDQEVMSLA